MHAWGTMDWRLFVAVVVLSAAMGAWVAWAWLADERDALAESLRRTIQMHELERERAGVVP